MLCIKGNTLAGSLLCVCACVQKYTQSIHTVEYKKVALVCTNICARTPGACGAGVDYLYTCRVSIYRYTGKNIQVYIPVYIYCTGIYSYIYSQVYPYR